MAAIARMRAVVLDCPDPRALADFYRALVGGELTVVEDDWVALRDESDVRLSFQRVKGFRPPVWPDGDPPQQFHLDVTVDDIDAAEAAVLEVGAIRHTVQPGDPDGGHVGDNGVSTSTRQATRSASAGIETARQRTDLTAGGGWPRCSDLRLYAPRSIAGAS